MACPADNRGVESEVLLSIIALAKLRLTCSLVRLSVHLNLARAIPDTFGAQVLRNPVDSEVRLFAKGKINREMKSWQTLSAIRAEEKRCG